MGKHRRKQTPYRHHFAWTVSSLSTFHCPCSTRDGCLGLRATLGHVGDHEGEQHGVPAVGEEAVTPELAAKAAFKQASPITLMKPISNLFSFCFLSCCLDSCPSARFKLTDFGNSVKVHKPIMHSDLLKTSLKSVVILYSLLCGRPELSFSSVSGFQSLFPPPSSNCT